MQEVKGRGDAGEEAGGLRGGLGQLEVGRAPSPLSCLSSAPPPTLWRLQGPWILSLSLWLLCGSRMWADHS